MKNACARSVLLVFAASLMLAPLAQAAERSADGMRDDRSSTLRSPADEADRRPARSGGAENAESSSLYDTHSPLGPGAPAASSLPESAGDDGGRDAAP